VEPLAGESEADYVARQAQLREEAAARMRAKFGASGGLGGSIRMGGIGSSPIASDRNRSASGELLTSGLSALGSAASSAGWLLGSAASSAAAAAVTAKDKISSARGMIRQPSAFSASDVAHLQHTSGSPSCVEGSSDISDLLGGFEREETAASGHVPSVAPASTPALSSVSDLAPSQNDNRIGDGWGVTPPSLPSAAPTLGHFSSGSGSGVVVRRKVAAVKGSSDGWDDDDW